MSTTQTKILHKRAMIFSSTVFLVTLLCSCKFKSNAINNDRDALEEISIREALNDLHKDKYMKKAINAYAVNVQTMMEKSSDVDALKKLTTDQAGINFCIDLIGIANDDSEERTRYLRKRIVDIVVYNDALVSSWKKAHRSLRGEIIEFGTLGKRDKKGMPSKSEADIWNHCPFEFSEKDFASYHEKWLAYKEKHAQKNSGWKEALKLRIQEEELKNKN